MNLYHGLLFQNGHITDVQLARTLAADRPATASGSAATVPSAGPSVHAIAARRLARATAFIEALRWLAEELRLLGGRPVSPGHLDDINEPFPPVHPCH